MGILLVFFEKHRLSLTESLVQSVELEFWDDMKISILFGKIAVYFSLKDINCPLNILISFSLGPLTPLFCK